jgi:hypothetical protein
VVADPDCRRNRRTLRLSYGQGSARCHRPIQRFDLHLRRYCTDVKADPSPVSLSSPQLDGQAIGHARRAPHGTFAYYSSDEDFIESPELSAGTAAVRFRHEARSQPSARRMSGQELRGLAQQQGANPG